MTKTACNASLDLYCQYLQRQHLSIAPQLLAGLTAAANTTSWDEPESAIDLNNFAVLALIEAEQCEDIALRTMHLEMAVAALTQDRAEEHPLCTAHLAVIHRLTGELQIASRLAFAKLINTLQAGYAGAELLPKGLVYLPSEVSFGAIAPNNLMELLDAGDGYAQAHGLLAEVLCRSQLAFYNASGLRFLNLAAQLMPDSVNVNLRLGISKLNHQHWEGILHLQQARKLAPEHAPILQSLYLAYRGQQPDVAEFWRKTAQNHRQQRPEAPEWQWANLDSDSPFTYIPFDDLLLAVEPSFNSKVTSVLLAEADWFEAEMEFWRDRLQPDMTVIDVGANAGVYTFSAAQRVGQQGRVVAIEPFSACVQYLRETCRVNRLSQVTVCAGAASDRNGTARLALHTASEQNELVSSSFSPTAGQFEDIPCFSLDQVVEQEQLDRIDWLKIDAEGHEMQVLWGSDRLLRQFAPGILYENIAGTNQSNLPVAEFLQSRGYTLFRYQPYVQQLLPIASLEALDGNLNIIALPTVL